MSLSELKLLLVVASEDLPPESVVLPYFGEYSMMDADAVYKRVRKILFSSPAFGEHVGKVKYVIRDLTNPEVAKALIPVLDIKYHSMIRKIDSDERLVGIFRSCVFSILDDIRRLEV